MSRVELGKGCLIFEGALALILTALGIAYLKDAAGDAKTLELVLNTFPKDSATIQSVPTPEPVNYVIFDGSATPDFNNSQRSVAPTPNRVPVAPTD